MGTIRRTVAQASEQAQASAADLETSRLSLYSELAFDYFDLRSADAQIKLLNDTVKAFQNALQLTEDRYNGGASPLSDVTQARTQLQQAQVQATDVAIMRASYEHAIAVLIGKPPAAFNWPLIPSTFPRPPSPPFPARFHRNCLSGARTSPQASAPWPRPTNRSGSHASLTIPN